MINNISRQSHCGFSSSCSLSLRPSSSSSLFTLIWTQITRTPESWLFAVVVSGKPVVIMFTCNCVLSMKSLLADSLKGFVHLAWWGVWVQQHQSHCGERACGSFFSSPRGHDCVPSCGRIGDGLTYYWHFHSECIKSFCRRNIHWKLAPPSTKLFSWESANHRLQSTFISTFLYWLHSGVNYDI